MRYLPIDMSTFSAMIKGNYIYVDKTECIYHLFKKGAPRYYFLSRPRRFGKTLLISTLKELFLSNKDLFKGLWIEKSDYQWEQHPVIHLDFGAIAHDTVPEFKLSLSWNLAEIAREYALDISDAPTLDSQFTALVKRLAQKNKVVILIDEYDKPILDHISDIPEALRQRNLLKSFYDILKSVDAHLRAIFITGVSKFAKTSIFSGINNLNDISLKPEAAKLLGYTHEEIEHYFKDYLESFQQTKNIESVSNLLEKLRAWYNGYRFSEEQVRVYNPFSVLYCLRDRKFRNYWFESATPLFLVSLLRKQFGTLEDASHLELPASSLGTFDLENVPLIPLLFQSGYLTFNEYYPQTDSFTLHFPNYEVEESFKKFLVSVLSYANPTEVEYDLVKLKRAINTNNLDAFCQRLEELFAHIPYTLQGNKESLYHALFQFLLSLLSLRAQSEVVTNRGRIDLTLTTKTHIYIFELKVGVKPEIALKQIEDKRYYQRFIGTHKHIVLVGLSFFADPHKTRLSYATQELS
jgi:hypothetical protein